MVARRDAAGRAVSEPAATAEYVARIERGTAARRESLVELEMALGLESPAEFQAQRLALQVQQLRNRFQDASKSAALTPGERLLAWCAEPGIAEERDRQRLSAVLAAVERLR